MRSSVIALLALLAASVAGANLPGCATRPATSVATSAAVQPGDFDVLLPTGSLWTGTLTYLNYTDSQPVTIPSTFKLTKAADGWLFAIGYNEEPHANSAVSFKLLDGGATIANGDTTEHVEGRRVVGNRIEITTISTGIDDNKPASIRKVYSIAPAAFSMQKLVKFADGSDWFERHIYRWTR